MFIDILSDHRPPWQSIFCHPACSVREADVFLAFPHLLGPCAALMHCGGCLWIQLSCQLFISIVKEKHRSRQRHRVCHLLQNYSQDSYEYDELKSFPLEEREAPMHEHCTYKSVYYWVWVDPAILFFWVEQDEDIQTRQTLEEPPYRTTSTDFPYTYIIYE